MDTDTNNIKEELEGTEELEEPQEEELKNPQEKEAKELEELEEPLEEEPQVVEEVVKEEEEIVEVKEELREEEDDKMIDIESASEDEDDGDTTDKPQEDHDHHSDSVKSEGGFKKSDVRCQNFFNINPELWSHNG